MFSDFFSHSVRHLASSVVSSHFSLTGQKTWIRTNGLKNWTLGPGTVSKLRLIVVSSQDNRETSRDDWGVSQTMGFEFAMKPMSKLAAPTPLYSWALTRRMSEGIFSLQILRVQR